ncbi:MAG: penicillin-binding protein 2 [bacterium]
MASWRKHKKAIDEDSRIKYLMLTIFVLGTALIFQLYKLQVKNYNIYAGMAQRQQEVKATLNPGRGRIFITDSRDAKTSNEIFPLATNKQFATVFAKPNMVTEPQKIAETLFVLADEATLVAQIESRINNDPKYASSTADFKKFKRDVDIKASKEAAIARYYAILTKKNDPYEVLIKKASEEMVEQIKTYKFAGIDFSFEMARYYPENNIGSHLLGFVGYVGDKKQGRYGLEGYFDAMLEGRTGSILADRDARGGIIVMNDKDYKKAVDGSDIFLTINRSIQYNTCQKLAEAVNRHGADGGTVIIMEPKTGAIIAMCSYPDYDPNNYQEVRSAKTYRNPAIYDNYEPGSTFKAITLAAALDQGKVTPESTYNDTGQIMIDGWNKPISNSDFSTFGAHGKTTVTTMLEKSLNVGAIWTMNQIGPVVFSTYVKKFGFGEDTGIELDSESSGNIANLTSKKIKPISAATASFGQGITVTPIQMATAYAAIANGGHLMRPYIVKEIVSPSGVKQVTEPKEVSQVMSTKAATILTGVMVNAVENGHAMRAQVPGYYVAGKTGTAQVSGGSGKGYGSKYIHSFIGFMPISAPKFVILTKLDDPKDAKYAESTAVPLSGEISKFIIDYYQIPQERDVK